MKALSIRQPWATAVVLGTKCIETRTWNTRHRGPLLIHASAHINKGRLIHQACCWNWCGALSEIGMKMGERDQYLWEMLDFGAIIGQVDVVDTRCIGDFMLHQIEHWQYPAMANAEPYGWTERHLGRYDNLHHFGWILENPVRFEEPIPLKGQQGLFEVDWEI